MPNPLTPEEVALARKLRQQGESWSAISRTLGRQGNFVRCQLDVEFRDHRALLSRSWTKRQKLIRLGTECPKPHFGKRPDAFFIPPDVEADRARRALMEPVSLTAALMGDPPVGRSALDKRKPKLVVAND